MAVAVGQNRTEWMRRVLLTALDAKRHEPDLEVSNLLLLEELSAVKLLLERRRREIAATPYGIVADGTSKAVDVSRMVEYFNLDDKVT